MSPGNYGIKYTTFGEYDRDLPSQSIGSGESVTTAIPGAGVLTVYQKCGTTNSGDLNNDTIVNFGDLAILAYYWTHCVCVEPHWCGCSDFNQSGSVNFTDFAIFAHNWLLPGPASNPHPDDVVHASVNNTLEKDYEQARRILSRDRQRWGCNHSLGRLSVLGPADGLSGGR